MDKMVPFQYSGFWDAPLGIYLEYWGKPFVLLREFDEELDEYEDHYKVYVLPHSASHSPLPSISDDFWKSFGQLNLAPAGQIPVSLVKFDPTKRKELDASILDELVVRAAKDAI